MPSAVSVGTGRRTSSASASGFAVGSTKRRADLSPDGRHLIYFARGGGRHQETKGSWTAISRVPWLHALTLYGKGDCWQGGGLFTSNRKYWLNGCHFVVRQNPEISEHQFYRPAGSFGAECPSVYYRRLLRDGWTLEMKVDPSQVSPCTVFAKELPHGWILRKFAYADVAHPNGTSVYWDEHELEDPGRRKTISYAAWEWAERDGNAVLWTERGILYRAAVNPSGLASVTTLYDFNPMRFERREAPY